MAILVAAIAALLATPMSLLAHARLTKSEPAAKTSLSVAPRELRLWFSEAPEVAMSRISLTDSSGKTIPLGAVRRGNEKLLIQATVLSLLSPGRYTVTWRVAGADGHPSAGSFTFTVTAPAPAADSTAIVPPVTGQVSDATAPVHVAARALVFGALILVLGGLTFGTAILPRVTEISGMVRERIESRSASLVRFAAIVLLVVAGIRLVLQAQMMASVLQEEPDIIGIVTETAWGRAWVYQVAMTILIGLCTYFPRRFRSSGRIIAVGSGLALAATPALSGHAAAAPTWTSLSIVTDTAHVVGAAGWLGSLAFVCAVGVPALVASGSDERWTAIASLVNTFSPVALTFAGIVLLTGVVSAGLRLGSISALWQSTYGRMLLVKLATLVGVAGTGGYNWLRVRPSLGSEIATKRLQRSAAVELVIGALIVIVTAMLVATPTPAEAS